MNTLVYLVYGSKREYQLELMDSVLSAAHFAASGSADLCIVLITDEANQRPDLPLETVVFSAAEFASWTQHGRYHFAAKIHALRQALDLFKGKVALVDTDTYFNVDPPLLFAQTGPGRAVMHAYESLLSDDPLLGPILQQIGQTPSLSYPVGPNTRVFNSGVIGLDHRDRDLVRDVLALCKGAVPNVTAGARMGETRDAWSLCWRELARARKRGQLRATASSMLVAGDPELEPAESA